MISRMPTSGLETTYGDSHMPSLKALRLPTAILKYSFFCFILLFINPSYLFAQESSVELTSVSGKAEVLLTDADEYIEAQEGMLLEPGDKIRTGGDGSTEVSFNKKNSNVVRMQSDTETTILLDEDEKLEVLKGEVFSSIADLPEGGAFEIRTPTAVTGARGTDWVTMVDEEGTKVEAVEDNPYVKEINHDGSIARESTVVRAGSFTVVRPFQRPQALQRLPESRQRHWQQMKGEVRQRASKALERRKERPPFNREKFVQDLREKRPEVFRKREPGDSGRNGMLRSDERRRDGGPIERDRDRLGRGNMLDSRGDPGPRGREGLKRFENEDMGRSRFLDRDKDAPQMRGPGEDFGDRRQGFRERRQERRERMEDLRDRPQDMRQRNNDPREERKDFEGRAEDSQDRPQEGRQRIDEARQMRQERRQQMRQNIEGVRNEQGPDKKRRELNQGEARIQQKPSQPLAGRREPGRAGNFRPMGPKR